MTLDPEFVKVLRCLETGSTLSLVSRHELDTLNQAISSRRITNRIGQIVEQPLESALINDDRTWVYPVRNGIPVMIAEHAIPYRFDVEEQIDHV